MNIQCVHLSFKARGCWRAACVWVGTALHWWQGQPSNEAISKCLRNHSVPQPMSAGLTSRVHVYQLNVSVYTEDSLGYLC